VGDTDGRREEGRYVDGDIDGSTVGQMLGKTVGRGVGLAVGSLVAVGLLVSSSVGTRDGYIEEDGGSGCSVGSVVLWKVGEKLAMEGWLEGTTVLGEKEGGTVGDRVGYTVGALVDVGFLVGCTVGSREGYMDEDGGSGCRVGSTVL
jgi:hypothetical protein